MDVSDHLLLTPTVTETFPKSVILIATRPARTPQEMRIVLFAPGLSKDSQDCMRLRLSDALRQALPILDRGWVHRVRMKYNAEIGISEIVVLFKDSNPVGAESQDTVLGLVQKFLVPTGKRLSRRVFTLKDGHRLVPLDFMFAENKLQATLPPKVELVHPYDGCAGILDAYTEDACTLLRSNLTGTLLGMRHRFQSVEVTMSLSGFVVDLNYEEGQVPSAEMLRTAEQVICEKVSMQGWLNKSEGYDRLVCCSAK